VERIVELDLNKTEQKMLAKSVGAVSGLVDTCKGMMKAAGGKAGAKKSSTKKTSKKAAKKK
jgi:hypothetical protein